MSLKFVFVLLLIVGIATSRPNNNIEVPESVDLGTKCKLPAYKGHCRALIPRWRYDPETQSCKEFKYGGCNGNGNNFFTYEMCMETCEGIQ
ncbi:PREDICTED: hemolymph trypsin inhibitor A-like [Nicrophorus vespilloides]|uniref:Hemolymph trypsin inhibitor A-like n=1 Tax=Nicrophorus vespilloides TaxID=110193 RepID=A0ABM1M9T2_NICVS|nr:PREDICTED: hemolymph trypsin inhibitor A-like [Nicrophorus vespilloides]